MSNYVIETVRRLNSLLKTKQYLNNKIAVYDGGLFQLGTLNEMNLENLCWKDYRPKLSKHFLGRFLDSKISKNIQTAYQIRTNICWGLQRVLLTQNFMIWSSFWNNVNAMDNGYFRPFWRNASKLIEFYGYAKSEFWLIQNFIFSMRLFKNWILTHSQKISRCHRLLLGFLLKRHQK